MHFLGKTIKNYFTAQPQLDENASSIHNSRSNTRKINFCYNKCYLALYC